MQKLAATHAIGERGPLSTATSGRSPALSRADTVSPGRFSNRALQARSSARSTQASKYI